MFAGRLFRELGHDHHDAFEGRLIPPEASALCFFKDSQITLIDNDPVLPPVKVGIQRIVISGKSQDCMCWRDSGPPTKGISNEDPESLRKTINKT